MLTAAPLPSSAVLSNGALNLVKLLYARIFPSEGIALTISKAGIGVNFA
jgi:hypothetical protein